MIEKNKINRIAVEPLEYTGLMSNEDSKSKLQDRVERTRVSESEGVFEVRTLSVPESEVLALSLSESESEVQRISLSESVSEIIPGPSFKILCPCPSLLWTRTREQAHVRCLVRVRPTLLQERRRSTVFDKVKEISGLETFDKPLNGKTKFSRSKIHGD